MSLAPETLPEQVRRANLEVHRKEASVYDRIHTEIFNGLEQGRIWADLRDIAARLPGPPHTALDVGCGTGNLSVKLAQLGFRVLGVDLSLDMLQALRRKDPNVLLVCAEAESFLSLENHRTYSLVSLSSVLHHLADYLGVLEACLDRVAPGGVLYVTHEPLPRRAGSLALQKQIARFTRPLRRLWYRSRGIRLPALDYSLSDIHAWTGLDTAAMLERVHARGFRVLKEERYFSNRRALATRVTRRLLASKVANTFSLVAQRA